MGDLAAVSAAGIRLDDVTVAYGRHQALREVSGSFEPGSLTAITGPNGAGKSTLLKTLMGELAPARGTIDRGGSPVRDYGYLPQAAEIDRQFPLTVADTVMLGAWREVGPFGRLTASCARRAREALLSVGLEGFERRRLGSLSAGQFQRVLFARLLLQDARVIVLDEPFTAIDARTTRELLDIVRRWNQDGRTVIAVLHDFEQVRANFPRTLLLARETIAWGATTDALSPANLLRARAMSEAWDDAPDAERRLRA